MYTNKNRRRTVSGRKDVNNMKRLAYFFLCMSCLVEFIMTMIDYLGLVTFTGEKFLIFVVFQIIQIEIMCWDDNKNK